MRRKKSVATLNLKPHRATYREVLLQGHDSTRLSLRGPSAANFSEDAGIHVTEENPVVGPVRVNLRTRWISVGVQSKMPGHIWLEVSGSASSLDEAAEQFSRSAVVFLPVVAIAANASVDDPEMELAFETTATASERDFLQCHIPDEQGAPRRGRRIDPIATVALLEAIQRSVHRERVLRAVNQYRLSLQSWRFGYESIAVAHLWMAAEALTKAVLRAEIQRRGLTSEADLASALGVDIKVLDSTIRRQIIFAGDTECYENGKGASDGLEHGFLGFDEIRTRAASIRLRMARLVRNAVFDVLDVPAATATLLGSAPFDEPLGNWSMVRSIRGSLVGTGEQLAATGRPYPILAYGSR